MNVSGRLIRHTMSKFEYLDENLLIALNNFGRKRGTIAHSTKSSILTTPDDALNTVNEIISLIDTFDTFLHQFKKET